MKVLIIEDDKKLLMTYKRILTCNFFVETASNLLDARKIINNEDFDVVLLDIMLPDGKGYGLIPSIKKKPEIIVIVISALEEEATRRMAYEMGADDYMIKPVTLFELEYKLKAISKRRKNENLIIRIGDLILNLEDLTLSTAHSMITIQHSQSIVLKMLFDKYKENDILHKNELNNLEVVRKSDNFRIHTLMSRLRKNIEELESDRVFIENVYGKGYRLVVMK
ncbi:response regulator transcription factor [Vallitalea sp.]|jgi:DNA-binding response OmpR family regulator|uniref:response regulator transcription factor n=1 Tax=Vallitalea sp. TaxID=1882829 RepID=UPI0025CF2ACE|nr:response regulator transcription factor [Vallitalea sp.]MCT4687989.1 response regulator transcription factor [Vallitalea sp.]